MYGGTVFFDSLYCLFEIGAAYCAISICRVDSKIRWEFRKNWQNLSIIAVGTERGMGEN